MSADNYLVAQKADDGWWALEGWMSFYGQREILLAKFPTKNEALSYCDEECYKRGEYGNPVEYGINLRIRGTMQRCTVQPGPDYGEQFDYVAEDPEVPKICMGCRYGPNAGCGCEWDDTDNQDRCRTEDEERRNNERHS